MKSDRGLDTELGSPKYARIELERRWLVDKARRPSLDSCDFTLIEDRYLAGTRIRLRRMTRPREDRTLLKLTKKYETDRPEARPIVTTYLSAPEFDAFAGLPAVSLRKRRYHLAFDRRYWSLDLFEDALDGLEILEVEAQSQAELAALVPPSWCASEITDDIRYQCGALARNGRPSE